MEPGHTHLRFVVLHRGEPPSVEPDPWAASAGARVTRLAQAIATSDGWRGRAAALVVREAPEPLIAAIGHFDEADEQWLTVASQQLVTTLERVTLLDHTAADAAAAALAAALEGRFGAAELHSFRYAAIPRGGFIVLGALAYLLDLPRDRLRPSSAAAPVDRAPLVLVDDIAISGLRLSQTVAAQSEPRLVIATLHAHPDLREAFLAAHPRVEAFVAAHDLRDHAPHAMGDAYDAWLERWRQRADPGTLWIGQGDHVVYPWNEPDVGVWNRVSGREEPGWSVVPPDRCLKRQRTAALAVQPMPPTHGRLRPHPEVVFGELDGRVVIGHLGTGSSYALDGVAADIWRALADTNDRHATTARLTRLYEVDDAALERDVTGFVDELLASNLVVEGHA